MDIKIIKLKVTVRCAECNKYIEREVNCVRRSYKKIKGFSRGTGIKLVDEFFTVG